MTSLSMPHWPCMTFFEENFSCIIIKLTVALCVMQALINVIISLEFLTVYLSVDNLIVSIKGPVHLRDDLTI